MFERNCESYEQISASSDNPGQNILQKVKKSSKIGQGNKTLISSFAKVLTASAKT